MARVVRFHRFGDPDVLQLDTVAIGAPGPGEVRIRVGAFGLNRIETLYRRGEFGAVSFPAKIGYEAAGIIDAVGSGVTNWKTGDRVATLFGLPMERYGTHGEQILYPADRLVPVAAGLSLTDAAASWMMYGTAYALVDVAQIDTGDVVIVNAASSSVGIAALQIANRHGAIPIAITRGRAKAAALKSLGAAHVIVSDEEDVTARVLEITNGNGARIAFDAIGGAPLTALLEAVAPLGVIIVYGMMAGYALELALPQLMLKNLTLRGFSADLLINSPTKRALLTNYVSSGLAGGALKPVISRIFDISDTAAAHHYLESNEQIGKVVVTTSHRDA